MRQFDEILTEAKKMDLTDKLFNQAWYSEGNGEVYDKKLIKTTPTQLTFAVIYYDSEHEDAWVVTTFHINYSLSPDYGTNPKSFGDGTGKMDSGLKEALKTFNKAK